MSPEETKAMAELQELTAKKQRDLEAVRADAAKIVEAHFARVAEVKSSREARELAEAKAAGYESWEAYQLAQVMAERDRRNAALQRWRIEKSGIPGIHRQELQTGVTLTEQQQVIYSAAMVFVGRGGIVAIIGARGTGKTLLSAKILEDWSKHGDCKYAKVMDLFRDLRDTYIPAATRTESAVIADYLRPSLLILDEAHERTGSAWELTQLTDLIDRRYSAGNKATLILSNQTRAALAENLGASICSRVRETGDVFELTGDSYREIIRAGREAAHV